MRHDNNSKLSHHADSKSFDDCLHGFDDFASLLYVQEFVAAGEKLNLYNFISIIYQSSLFFSRK
jgi:hypothetical protein